jgi:hypothetical protein
VSASGDDPACGIERIKNGTAERAGDVMALFGPVDATAHRAQPGWKHRTQRPKLLVPLGCEAVVPLVDNPAGKTMPAHGGQVGDAVGSLDEALLTQRVSYCHSQSAADVVVAASGQSQRMGPGPFAERPYRLGRRQPANDLDQPRHIGPASR